MIAPGTGLLARACAALCLLLATPAIAGDAVMYRNDASRSGAYSGKVLRRLVRLAWIFPREQGETVRLTPLAAGRLVFVSVGTEVAALDAATGKTRWRRPVPPRSAGQHEEHHGGPPLPLAMCSIPAHASRTLFFSTTDGRALALDAATGKPRWSSSLVVDVEALCRPECTGQCGAEPQDGDESNRYEWEACTEQCLTDCGLPYTETEDSFTDPDSGPSCPPAAVAAGTLYLGFNGWLHALDARTGKQRWRYWAAKPFGSPVISGDRVLISGIEAIALDAKTGKERWRETGSGPGQEPVLDVTPAAAGNSLFFGGLGRLLVVDPGTGKLRFTVELYSEEDQQPLLQGLPAVSGHTAYLTTGYGGLAAVDVSKKKILWDREAERGAENELGPWFCSSPVLDDEVVYVSRHLDEAPSPAGELLVLDRETGAKRLSFTVPLPEMPPDSSWEEGSDCPDPVVAGQLVLFSDGAGKLYALRDLSAADRKQARQANSQGMKLYSKKQYAKAAEQFGRAITLDPDHRKAYYNLSCMLALQAKPGDACALCEQVLPALRKAAEIDPRVKAKAGKDGDYAHLRGSAAFQGFVGIDPGKPKAAKTLLVEGGPFYGSKTFEVPSCAWCPPATETTRGRTLWFRADGRFRCAASIDQDDSLCFGQDKTAGTYSVAGAHLKLKWTDGTVTLGQLHADAHLTLGQDGFRYSGCPVCPLE